MEVIGELKPFIKKVWEQSQFKQPTNIQQEAIPVVLEGKDLIAQSPTGTGKTLAYLLPVLEKIQPESKDVQVVILASSQELIMQILSEAQKWGRDSNIRSASFIGGANVRRQLEKLKQRPHIVLGTPGRILELIKQKKLKMHAVKTVVLDEGDQLLIPEHLEHVKSIIKATLKERQVVLFSATLPKTIEVEAKGWMKSPEVITIEKDETITAGDVGHIYFNVEQREKVKLLEKLSRMDHLKALVFVKDIPNIMIMKEKLEYNHIHVNVLHSDLNKFERSKNLNGFRKKDARLLLSTDVAARGLDIKGITHVIHFDLPREKTQYIHRSGRTGRFGADGTVVSLVTMNEERDLKRFAKELNLQLEEKIMHGGKIVNPERQSNEKRR
ncbi:DEAD/DEAH box helicase [Cytobacillus sp. FSL W7-1323]|uniref:DEAD/DEAH box helicase n=1 Tax=unclassified Cytobacillus TaxID=2675268 RepID=UPI002AFDDEAA|nr:DEAD/DEAH box helicase [Cytobacillus sp. OWB-43]MEA1854321.1 DEAD/DEAH box helicase [Cytobacillus sp. OWB-43]